MQNVLALILGGGLGTRLYPLTKLRAKPAVPVGGKYRLIDIPVSNCINSKIHKIFILTQFNSVSLNRHVNLTYNFSSFLNGFVEVLAAQQTINNDKWFQGTADAIRQYLPWLEGYPNDEYLILAGDHLYRMDYRPFIKKHRESGADISISVIPRNRAQASELGLVKINEANQITEFSEKPVGAKLDEMKISPANQSDATSPLQYLASMGIYVFKPKVLHDLLRLHPERHDFAKHILPNALTQGYQIQAFMFNDYWEDIGTIKNFYKANIDLVRQPNPVFSFYHEDAPIISKHRILPPSMIVNSNLVNSFVCEGASIQQAEISRSIVGIRSVIKENVIVEDSMIMGADFFQTADEIKADLREKHPPLGIGKNSTIRRAIVDKNVRIGENVKIINQAGIQEAEREREGFCIRDGIVLILKNSVIQDNTVI